MIKGQPKPKPKPRIRKLQDAPLPKPRNRVPKSAADSDDLESLSSMSSTGDRLEDAAYDNPVFEAGEGDRKVRVRHVSGATEESKDGYPLKKQPEQRKTSQGKGARPFRPARSSDNNAGESSSAWEGEEVHLSTKHFLQPMKEDDNVSPDISAKSEGSGQGSEGKKRGLWKKEGKKPSKEETEMQLSANIPVATKKNKLGSIWQRFVSRNPQPQPDETDVDKETKSPVKKEKHSPNNDKTRESDENKSIEEIVGPQSLSESEEDDTIIVPRTFKGGSPRLSSIRKEESFENKTKVKSPVQVKAQGQLLKPVKDREQTKQMATKIKGEKSSGTKGRRSMQSAIDESEQHSSGSDSTTEEPKLKTEGRRPRKKESHKKEFLRKFKKRSSNPSDEEIDKDALLGTTVHGTEMLPLDPNMLHPVVKVILMTQEGKLLHRSDSFGDEDHSNKKRKRRKAGTDNILPVMTQPFKFQLNMVNPVITPSWNELLLFEKHFYEFIEEGKELIVFFEILDFVSMDKVDIVGNDGLHGSDLGWYKLAWAFLKPLGSGGIRNTGKTVKLQLFKPVKLRQRERLDVPEVYSWWKSNRREKIPMATLAVTVKGIIPSLPTMKSFTTLHHLLSMRKEELTDAVVENQLKEEGKSKKSLKKSSSGAKGRASSKIPWSRLEGQSCKVPNKLLAALPASPVESLHLTISGNVHCMKFSPCGSLLAAGLDTEELHAILIFEIPSGTLLRSFKNHHGLLYDLDWTQEAYKKNHFKQSLVSASADGTACIWIMSDSDETTMKLATILHHPSFVYAAKFHPTIPGLVVTACFDFIIRIWEIREVDYSRNNGINHQTPSPLIILDKHTSFVNCLAFGPSGSYLFSGDGDSTVIKWHASSRKKPWVLERETKLADTGRVPVNSLSVHPNGVRLLVHLRDSSIRILDATSLIQLKHISGFTNDRLQIRSCFSPCGNLILCGNEDTSFCIWDGDTYALADFIYLKNRRNCFVTCVEYHPHDYYVAVGVASITSEPNPIVLYTYESPKFSQVATVQASIARFKSNLHNKGLKGGPKKDVTFSTQRGDSSEKFKSIIDKLDHALKHAHKEARVRALQRAVSVDEGRIADKDSQKTISRTATMLPVTEEKREPNNGSEKVIEKPGRTTKGKISSKSPRTYIEDRLEELIVPKRDEGRNPNQTDTEKQTSILSKQRLQRDHKTKSRPQSSKIPKRIRNEEKNYSFSSAPSSPSRRTEKLT